MNKTLVLIILCLHFVSCEEEPENRFEISETSSRESDNKLLDELHEEILVLSNQVTCTNANEWEITAIGAKACGGPTGYIAYSSQIDKIDFLDKVNRYTSLQDFYNQKWGVVSDCMFLTPPKGIECINGFPEFIY